MGQCHCSSPKKHDKQSSISALLLPGNRKKHSNFAWSEYHQNYLKQNKNEKEGKNHSISNRVISIVDAIFSSIKSRKTQISTLREYLCNQGLVQAFVQTDDKHKTFVRPAELKGNLGVFRTFEERWFAQDVLMWNNKLYLDSMSGVHCSLLLVILSRFYFFCRVRPNFRAEVG